MTPTKEASDTDIFRTITIGTHSSKEALLEKIEAQGNKISDWARDIISQPEFELASEPEEIDLVVKSFSDLGFEGSATFDQIKERAQEMGLELCPPEVVLQLRLQYQDQPEGERLVVAHAPITDSNGVSRLLYVPRRSDGFWLDDWTVVLEFSRLPSYRFVFVRGES